MLDNLYNDIGKKIKSWAKWIFIIEAIGAIIAGFVLMVEDEDLIGYGLLTLVCGPIVAWVGSWLLYAFGQITDDLHAMRNKECPSKKASGNNNVNIDEQSQACEPTHIDPIHQHKIARITELRKKGLITEEMYQSAINNPNILDKF